jgi:hypothetical protein
MGSPLFARRELVLLGVETPLLVPSFSSRGYRDLSDLFATLRGALRDVALVSAYDLHFAALPLDAADVADVVVVDSGGYEARPSGDLSEPYVDERAGRVWTADDYSRLLDRLAPTTLRLVVSFDGLEATPLDAQIEDATARLGSRGLAIDMLLKPEAQGDTWLDVARVVRMADRLAQFAAVGVTEKELGASPLERCSALVRLRQGLAAVGLGMPIHVFGCLTPLAITAYFLCGADVFDGLAWLRFAFDVVPSYIGELAIATGAWRDPDSTRYRQQCLDNLAVLRRLQRALRGFCITSDVALLRACAALGPNLPHVFELVRAAGAWAPEMNDER